MSRGHGAHCMKKNKECRTSPPPPRARELRCRLETWKTFTHKRDEKNKLITKSSHREANRVGQIPSFQNGPAAAILKRKVQLGLGNNSAVAVAELPPHDTGHPTATELHEENAERLMWTPLLSTDAGTHDSFHHLPVSATRESRAPPRCRP